MSGARGFSGDTLEKISKKLSLNEKEKNILFSLCEQKFSKSKKTKEAATEKLKLALIKQTHVADEKVALISDWYHMAILALIDSSEFKSDIAWISNQLSLHEKVAEKAIDRLILVGAIKKENEALISTGNLFIDPKGIPSSAVKEFHHQILNKADLAIDMQGLDDRDIASVLMCFDKNKIQEAKNRIKKFREDFELEFGPASGATSKEVYCLGGQFFQLTKLNN